MQCSFFIFKIKPNVHRRMHVLIKEIVGSNYSYWDSTCLIRFTVNEKLHFFSFQLLKSRNTEEDQTFLKTASKPLKLDEYEAIISRSELNLRAPHREMPLWTHLFIAETLADAENFAIKREGLKDISDASGFEFDLYLDRYKEIWKSAFNQDLNITSAMIDDYIDKKFFNDPDPKTDFYSRSELRDMHRDAYENDSSFEWNND